MAPPAPRTALLLPRPMAPPAPCTALLLLLLLLARTIDAAHVGVRVGALPPRHTAAGAAEGAFVSWPLVATDAALAAGLQQVAAELTVTDDVTGATLLRATRAFGDGGGGPVAGMALLSPAELARLPQSRALSYAVRARLSDGGWTACSAPARWAVGPGARAADWPGGAQWLCSSPTGGADARGTLLRAAFELPAGLAVARATLHVAGLGQFRAAVNGVDLLGSEFTAPAQTDWRKRVLYATYDVPTGVLVPGGANVLAASLANGMYNVPSPPQGRYTKWVGTFGPRMLLAALVVALGDGSNVTLATTSGDSSPWLATDGGPVSFTHEYAGEDRNASLEVPGWDAPGFDPSANPLVSWAPAADCTAAFPGGALAPADAEPVAVVADLPALSIVPSAAAGRMLVDVGRNFAGTATVLVSGVPPASTVRVWPSETLEGGAIVQASGGTPVYWQVHTLPGPPGALFNVTIAPTFSTYGWRWLEVEVLPTAAAVAAEWAVAGAVAGGAASVRMGAGAASAAAGPAPAPTAAAAAPPHSPNGTLVVLAATYGGSCDVGLAGDATAAVASFCDGAAACAFYVCVCGDNACPGGAPPCLPDPARNCAKDFAATWRCTGDAPGALNRSVYLPAEADNQAAQLGCGAPPSLPEVRAATGHFVRASARTVGTWASSSDWVNRIHAITLQAIAANLQSVLTDCPHRERLGWLEVSHLMFPSIAYNFDISRLWAKIARDTVDSQLPSGMVPDIAPEYVEFDGAFRDSPEWGSASILNPYWLWRTYGDSATLGATYATAAAYAAYLLARRNASTGLLEYGLGDWIPVVASPPGVTATAVLVQDLQALAAGAAALGRPGDAANFTALAAEVGAAYERAFNVGGAYPTQCAAGMALALGITPPAAVPAARAFLLRDVAARGNVSTSGEIGNRYALLALAEAGPLGIAAVWASLQRNTSPGYGYMLVRGETALAESWTDAPGDSHIHAMYGHVDEFLYAYIAGIRQAPGSVGWGHVLLAPALLRGLDWVDASFESPRGLVRVALNVTARSSGSGGGGAGLLDVELRATVPPGVVAEVTHPLSGRVSRVVGGAHVLRESGADVRV